MKSSEEVNLDFWKGGEGFDKEEDCGDCVLEAEGEECIVYLGGSFWLWWD